MHKVKNSLLIDNILDNGFGTLSGVLSSEKSELLSKKCKEILLSNYEFSGISEDSPKSRNNITIRIPPPKEISIEY